MNDSVLEIPNHIAIIMDGNARWAKKNSVPLKLGHKAGSEAIQTLVKSCLEYKVKYVTIYAFSTENWHRPKQEVSDLMGLLSSYLEKEVKKLIDNGVKIVVSGDLSNISKTIRGKIQKVQDITKDNKAIILNVAFDYGSRQEITQAFKKIMVDIQNKKITFDQVNEELISKNLYNPDIPDPDLLIRTAGEKRISNFLLWQSAYTEFYFTDKLWPDFNKDDLYQSILDFNQRQRRYGKR